jgi:16S rRNA (uracil1498-N3)-methyltransferase
LFVEPALEAGARVPLSPDQAHYLLHVMRRQAGEGVLLFNGRDGEWRARLAETSKRAAVLEVEARTRDQLTPPDLDLLVALVKRARLETIVEKAAELGCRRVRLVVTRRTNAERTNVERLQAIATEAAEQTGRLDVPEVLAPEKLDRLLDQWDPARRLMYCDEAAAGFEFEGEEGGSPPAGGGRQAAKRPEEGPSVPTVRPALDALAGQPAGPWAVLIGPEGGFDPAEQARLRGLPFVTPVGLGPRVLRADTAAISALTLWQSALGDWRGA